MSNYHRKCFACKHGDKSHNELPCKRCKGTGGRGAYYDPEYVMPSCANCGQDAPEICGGCVAGSNWEARA